jgi:hypothetical protein
VQESFYSGIAHYGMPGYRAVEYCSYRTVVQYSTVQYGSCGRAVSRVLCRELCVTSTVVLFLPTLVFVLLNLI